MADGVAQSEIFPEGQNGDEGGSNGDDRGGGEEDESDDDRNKNERCEDAFPSHGEEG